MLGKGGGCPANCCGAQNYGDCAEDYAKKSGKVLVRSDAGGEQEAEGGQEEQRCRYSDKRRDACSTAAEITHLTEPHTTSRNTRNKSAQNGRGSTPACMRAAAALRQ